MKTNKKESFLGLGIAVLVLYALSAGSDIGNSPQPDIVPFPLEDHHSNTYEWLWIEGWGVEVRFPENMDVDMMQDYTVALDLLARQLRRANGVLPQQAVSKLQSSTYFFFKDDCTDGGAIFYWSDPDLPEDEVEGWVILHCFKYIKNILDNAYHGAEEVAGSVVWGHPGIVLHELGHAWHELHVKDGYDNEMIEDFYDDAISCIANEDIDDPYYWESHKAEFFADFSVMYYLSHWDYPNHVWQMPKRFRVLIARVWNERPYRNWEDQIEDCD